MCLLAISVPESPEAPLVLVANRDEAWERPTAPASLWADFPGLAGGRDLKAGGTWLGVTHGGRFAALTNFREVPLRPSPGPSRGLLVRDFLVSGRSPRGFAAHLSATRHDYLGYNLLLGDPSGVWCYASRRDALQRMQPGVHGLCNGELDEPWPKLDRVVEGLRHLVAVPALDREACFEMMADDRLAPDDTLPDTGVGLALERRLSPVFIRGADYGTRSTTLLTLGPGSAIRLEERTYEPDGVSSGSVDLRVSR